MSKTIRVQIIENSQLEEAGLRSLLSECEDFEIIQHDICDPDCHQSCVSETPDVVVMELTPNGNKNIDCVRQIRARFSSVQVLVICSSGEPVACKMAMNAGAIGFVSKQIPPQIFIEAVHQVGNGKPFVEPWVAKRMVEAASKAEQSPFEILSNREHTILQLMLAGESNKLIAEKLHISINTLGNHRAHIKSKLGVSNLVELIRLAMRHGMIHP